MITYRPSEHFHYDQSQLSDYEIPLDREYYYMREWVADMVGDPISAMYRQKSMTVDLSSDMQIKKKMTVNVKKVADGEI